MLLLFFAGKRRRKPWKTKFQRKRRRRKRSLTIRKRVCIVLGSEGPLQHALWNYLVLINVRSFTTTYVYLLCSGKKKKKDKKHRKSRSSGDIDKSIGDKSDAELEATKRKVDALLARRMPKHSVDVEEEYLYGSGPGQQAKESMSREPGSAEKNALR